MTAATRRPPRSVVVDWLMTVGVLWVVLGIYVDLGWHLRNDVDSFFTWAHGLLYAGLVFTFVSAGCISLANARRGFPLLRAMPVGYELTLPGIVLFFIGGIGDGIGHTLWGFEEGFGALLSPTHQLIGFSIILLLVGPIRSALFARPRLTTFAEMLPATLATTAFLALVRWGIYPLTQTYAESLYRQPPVAGYSPDAITIGSLHIVMQGEGFAAVILSTLVMTGFVLFLARSLAAAPGALTLALVAGNGIGAIAVGESWPQALIPIAASLVAGIVGDAFLRRWDAPRTAVLRTLALAFCVPVVFHAVFFTLTALTGGVWWDPLFLYGLILDSGVFGVLLGLLVSVLPAPAREA